MDGRPDAFAGPGDVLIVVATAVFAFGIGAASTGTGVDSTGATPAIAPTFASSSGEQSARLEARSASAASRRSNNPDRASETPPATPASPARAQENMPRDRFTGEGAGRKGASATRDPYNRRSYILDTASSLHRRSWIGASAAVTTGAADLSIYPQPSAAIRESG